MKDKLNAILLSRIFLATLFVLFALGVAEIYFFKNMLSNVSTETNHLKIDAEISETNVERLSSLETQLKLESESVQRAQQIVAESQSYQFQNQVINDVTSYASDAGVIISGFSFQEAEQSAVPATPGPKKTLATIQLKGDVPIANYLLLLKYIENNLTKMQVKGVFISPTVDDRSILKEPSLDLEVFIE